MNSTLPLSPRASEVLSGRSLLEYVEIIRRRKEWIVLTVVAMFVATSVVAYRLPNIYRAETVIMVDPQKVPDSFVASPVTTSITDRLSTIQQQVLSPSRLKRIMDGMNLYPDLRGRANEDDLVRMMQGSIHVGIVAEGGHTLSAFRISFEGRNPAEVAQVANQLATMFIEENLRVRQQQFNGTAEFLDNELQSTRKQLEQKEAELRDIRTRFASDLPESRQFHMEALTSLRTQMAGSQDRAQRAQQERVYLQSLMAASAPTIDLDSNAPSGAPQETQLQRLESQLAAAQAHYGPQHPEVRRLKAQRDKLKSEASAEEAAKPASPEPPPPVVHRTVHNPVLEAQIQRLSQEIDEQKKQQAQLQPQIDYHLSKLERGPIFEQQFAGLMRDYDSLRQHYNILLDRKLSAQMASELESRQKGERFVVLDTASVPQKPAQPNRPLISLAGLLGGVLGGFGLALLVEMTDESVRSEKEAARILGKQILASIPHILDRRQQRIWWLRAIGALAGTVLCSAALGLLLSRFGGRFF